MLIKNNKSGAKGTDCLEVVVARLNLTVLGKLEPLEYIVGTGLLLLLVNVSDKMNQTL